MEAIKQDIQSIQLNDNGVFPNSALPVLLYKCVLYIPELFPAKHVKDLFEANKWFNAWDNGIYNYHHYHSITHEVLGVYKGGTTLQLGGKSGIKVKVEKGDVLVIPAGVAHKNLGTENAVSVVGAYPDGSDYDMNYGKAGERPKADRNIHAVLLPRTDPVYGKAQGLTKIWDDGYRISNAG